MENHSQASPRSRNEANATQTLLAKRDIDDQQGSSKMGSTAHQLGAKRTVIHSQEVIRSVAFLDSGRLIVSGGDDGKIRRWRMEDGNEVGIPIDVGNPIFSIAVSGDEGWVASGTQSGLVIVWNTENFEKATEFQGHTDFVRAIDISTDATKIATGSNDTTASIWSLSNGERLFETFKHNGWVVAAKFSPDGRFVATATWDRDSVRVYDSQFGHLLVEFPIQVYSVLNQSLVWTTDSKELLALSREGNINTLDVSTGTTLSHWPIHSNRKPRCIALTSDGAVIAASTNSSISFWDAGAHKQIGLVIEHPHVIWFMAITTNCDLVIGGKKSVTLIRLCDMILSSYDLTKDDDHPNEEVSNLEKTVEELHVQPPESEQKADAERERFIRSLRIQEESSNNVIVPSQASFQELRNELAKCRRAADKQKESSNEIIALRCADLCTQQSSPECRARCVEKLEILGDIARDSRNHEEAAVYYSNALSLNPENFNHILLKHSDEVIKINPSSYKGYEGKHSALHSMGRYGEAFDAFRMMLLKLEESPELQIRKLLNQYIDATTAIQSLVHQTVRHIPCVLIDTVTGRLHDKTAQAAAFEQLPVYDELRSSMTTRIDHARIRREVKNFYRYVMLSHKWQPQEPTFQMVEHTPIYELPVSPANNKVQQFCELGRSLHFYWAWSDTCCVNQLDKGVHQESLVAMFKWYRGSSLTIVHLFGVLSVSQVTGCLWKSVWNTRGWTYQEYLASKVVQFYTEDWKPYLGLDTFNHKESPVILAEMERAMNFSPRELAALQPGLGRVREKLYLASARQTTREEDMAYSLFGIFNVALPVIYGEGNQAVSRLLEYILSRSDNIMLLAWTGIPGPHHSYLPSDLTVYSQIMPPHIPPPLDAVETYGIITKLLSSFPDLSLLTTLYQRLYDLPSLSLVSGRLRLSGIVFPLSDIIPVPDPQTDVPAYRATAAILGNIEVETTDDLSGKEGLLLIHPWISPLLDQDFSCGVPRYDLATRALRLLVQLRQPFGALLLAPLSRLQHRRVATDSLIMVQVREKTSLTELLNSVRTVDIQ